MAEVITNLLKRIQGWKRQGRDAASAEKVSRIFKFKYTCFKDLLASNTQLLNIITDFEEKLRGQEVFGMSYIGSQAARAVFHTLRMVKSLDDLSGHKYPMLFGVLERINAAIKEELGRRKELPPVEFVLPYTSITKEMVDWVGGKNANLGELVSKTSVPVPEGFAITTRAYEFFLESNDLIDEINRKRMDLDPIDPQALNNVSEEIQRLIISARVPVELSEAILAAYANMVEKIGKRDDDRDGMPKVALRSSAIGEDSELSYAGQYVSILNVQHDKIIETYKYIIASLYTPRAISYRLNKGMRDEDIAMSVACIEMVESVAAGVVYTRHPSQPLGDSILINAVWGLGPYAVDGVITPDSYTVSKSGPRIVETKVSNKPVQLTVNPLGGLTELPVDPEKRNLPCLSEGQIETLAGYALKLEEHYQYPQDIEWSLDPHGRILVLQTRPLHLEDLEKSGIRASLFPRVEGYLLVVEGAAVAFPGVGHGPAFHVRTDEDLANFPEGAVLVAKHSTPQFVMVMQKAQAIVTDAGSVTGHMASLAREFGIPTLLDAKVATSDIPPEEEITVDAYSGRVYLGHVPELIALQKTRESAMKGTPVYQTLRHVADWIVPLNLVNPRSVDFAPEYCKTLHDVMRLVHEFSYKEMFQISDLVSDTSGGGARKLVAPIPLDLHIIDLGGGLAEALLFGRRVTIDQIASVPFLALLRGMLREDLRYQGPRPIDVGGFLSVIREQMLAPNNMAERFGDRSYAIISDHYLNFSSRIGYHYSVLDSYCSDSVNKNYITFSFKGGAADDVRRNRRARAIAAIFHALDFQVEVREDRVDARFYKYEGSVTADKLDLIGRLLQYTRQMDMFMRCEASVELLAKNFLAGNYTLDEAALCEPQA
ncbi:MAG: phosphoenolpyruvate synthase [Desulfomonile tiedjei]|nr:phosphoenolpyruvate synthase [Desulfomonile tiedjei]